jgi:hypothetical protein
MRYRNYLKKTGKKENTLKLSITGSLCYNITMSLTERWGTSMRIASKEATESNFFVDVTRSILSTDRDEDKQHKVKTVVAMLEGFTYLNPNVRKIIAEKLGFDIGKKNKYNTSEEESEKAEAFLIEGVMRTAGNALNPDDTSILGRTKTWIVEELGCPKGLKEKEYVLENLNRRLKDRLSALRTGEFKPSLR